MADSPLKLALLWHMHQPYYKNPRTGVYRLPWVRLHTVKDYYDMVARLEAWPKIKVNFNIVPCLIAQILDYAAGGVQEKHLDLSRKAVGDLTQEDKISLIQHFFLGNRKTMIEPHPRYASLLEKCSDLDSEYKVHAALRRFRRQDYLDLQVWSNLAWIGPVLGRDPVIRELRSRERHFTEAMKADLLEKHGETMRSVLGKYKDMVAGGRAEITISPFFHPILPLLCDSDSARLAIPEIRLPSAPVRFPEDAQRQIELGLDLHREIFGRVPKGMWPPEAAVSEDAVDLASRCGIKWMATDEGILESTLDIDLRDSKTGRVTRPDLLYRPHKMSAGGREISIFFRDRVLSDLISFGYWRLPARDAVEDFLARLEAIRRSLGPDTDRSVILVALDGENCWEFYDKGGDVFLDRFYEELSNCDGVETVLLSDTAEQIAVTPVLKSIYAGSWIGNDFSMWIGHREDNLAWDLLNDARRQLLTAGDSAGEAAMKSAWQSIYAAEGSDWFWWYSGEHVSREDPEFDALFRAHIRHVYETLGVHVPHKVLAPIMARKRAAAIPLEPAAMIEPLLDGKITTFYEWKLAGLYESYRDGTKGLDERRIIDAVYFGFDQENLYLRLDTRISPQDPQFKTYVFQIEFEEPAHRTFQLQAPDVRSPSATAFEARCCEAEGPVTGVEAQGLEIVEIKIPFAEIPASSDQSLSFRIAVLHESKVIERRPIHDMLTLDVPGPDFDAEHWSAL
jgi:alpha-amylase/alpha-mannosidase (GH57 family)